MKDFDVLIAEWTAGHRRLMELCEPAERKHWADVRTGRLDPGATSRFVDGFGALAFSADDGRTWESN